MPGEAAQTAAVTCRLFAGVPELPAGILNVFAESGSAGAELLVSSPHVPVISFTGSTATRKKVAAAAAANLKRIGLELGGKTPHLVFDDADLPVAVSSIVSSLTVFAGQFCMTGSRVLAQHGIAHDLRAALAERLRSVRPGPSADPTSDLGPLIHPREVTRVDGVVEDALRAGAKAVVRGGPSGDPRLAGGAFYLPTLLEVDDLSLPSCRKKSSDRSRPSRGSATKRTR